jgi:uncharacterized protein YybS (DUF2232 family)
MALATLPTFTPSAVIALVTPPPTQSDPAGISFPYFGIANTVALPAGSSPATVLITNLGPEPAFVLIATAVATTTGTASAGSLAVTLASGTSVVVGQAVVGTGIAQGTFVSAISGTALTLSQVTTAALVGGTLNFVAPVAPATGTAVQAGGELALAYVNSGFFSAFCTNGGSRAILNVAVGV